MPSNKQQDVKVIEQETVYRGYAAVEKYSLQHKLFAGGWSEIFTRELLVRHNAVAVLPYDPILDKVVLIEQFRIGAFNSSDNPWIIEVVAGVIDKGNSKEEIARLETQEEAGLELKELIPMYEYYSSPGALSEMVKIYCGIVDASNANGIHGVKDENEDIKVHVLSSQEAFDAIRTGKINNAATIIALQWLELNRDKLKP